MKQKIKLIAALVAAVVALLPCQLQAQDSASMKTRTFQVSLITPLGTNGFNSWNTGNKCSFNLLAGYAGGTDGVEFSGLSSVLKGNMTGVQFSGLGNVVLKDMKGVQFSGLGNIVLNEMKGAQFSGLANINTGKIKGFQMAGLINISAERLLGAQIAGLFNYAKVLDGTQVGVFNFTRELDGAQLGVFNYAKVLDGAQIGVFNYVDSLKNGVPIGILSFVKDGYMAFEIGSTETLFGVMSFKTGVNKFYNILSVGGGYRDGYSLFAWGYGLGAFVPVSKKVGLSIDGICYQVNEGEWFTQQLNLLNKLNITASFKIASHLAIYGGLSWNVTVSDITDEYGDPVSHHIAPYALFDEVYEDHLNVKMYPGISAGLRIL